MHAHSNSEPVRPWPGAKITILWDEGGMGVKEFELSVKMKYLTLLLTKWIWCEKFEFLTKKIFRKKKFLENFFQIQIYLNLNRNFFLTSKIYFSKDFTRKEPSYRWFYAHQRESARAQRKQTLCLSSPSALSPALAKMAVTRWVLSFGLWKLYFWNQEEILDQKSEKFELKNTFKKIFFFEIEKSLSQVKQQYWNKHFLTGKSTIFTEKVQTTQQNAQSTSERW